MVAIDNRLIMYSSRFHVGVVAIAVVSISLTSSFHVLGAFTGVSQCIGRGNDYIVKRYRLHQNDPARLRLSRVHHKFRSSIPEDHEQRQYWTLPRLYVGQSRSMRGKVTLSTGSMVPLLPEQTHYLIKVMRIMNNRRMNRRQQRSCEVDNEARIRIFNGEDGEWLAKVHLSIPGHELESSVKSKNRGKRNGRSHNGRGGDDSLVAECILQLRAQDYADDDRPWVLFVPLKKQPRMKIMIEKCTELGVGRLISVASDRMEGEASAALLGIRGDDIFKGDQADDNKLRIDKLEIQAIEASEQCERLGIPIITCDLGLSLHEKSSGELLTIRDVVEEWCRAWEAEEGRDVAKSIDQVDAFKIVSKRNTRRVLLICRERGHGGEVVPVLQALHDNKRVSFLVGPEGGWSANEEELFDEICSKYAGQDESPVQCVSLGSSVLRAETACLMAVGAWTLMEKS